MRIVTLMENTACREDLTCEHGLSLYIETENCRLLFDAGQSKGFAANAEKLGIDLGRVDLAVLSHGHYDHGGGLAHFLRINRHAPVFLSPAALGPHYHGPEKYIGLSPELAESPRLVFVENTLEPAPGITLQPCTRLPLVCPVDSGGLSVLEKGLLRPDDFCHEQYLLIEEAGRRILFTGCSHRGILNIAAAFQPDVLIGGFHLHKLDPVGSGAAALTTAARALLDCPCVYYTGHCTGSAQYAYLKRIMGSRLHALSAGRILEL